MIVWAWREGGEAVAWVSIKQVHSYRGLVNEPMPEPTLSDVMEVMRAGFSQLSTALATTNAKLDETNTKVDALAAKVETMDAKVDAVETSLRHEVRDAEVRLSRRLDDVQNVMRTLKGDVAAHLNDPGAHPHGHAA